VLVSLVGLPGVGKSTVGRRLAKHLGIPFTDCDSLIEQRIGEPIASFFEREGEAVFRDTEQRLLGDVVEESAAEGAVIATGGGVVLREANRRLLRERTVCIWLEAKPEALLERLGRSNRRPLFRVADPKARLAELAQEREPLYAEVATFRVAAWHDAGSTLAAIKRVLGPAPLPSEHAT
jgi:shikimate kinase